MFKNILSSRKALLENLVVYGLVAVIFAADASVPRGYSVWILYIWPIFLVSRPGFPGKPVPLLAICTVLTVVGVFLEPSLVPMEITLWNRGISILAGWVIGVLIIRNKRQEEQRERDLAERRLMEERLRERENTLSSIFRTVPAGLGLVRDRKFLFANESLERLTGFRIPELEGQSTRVLYPSDEEFERAGNIYNVLRREQVASFETKWMKKDGKIIDVMIVLSPTDPRGFSGEYVFSALDITERKAAEEKISRSEAFLKQVMASSLSGLYIYDIDAERIVFINPQYTAITGYTIDDLNSMGGNDFLALFHPIDRKRVTEHIGSVAALKTVEIKEIEYRFCRKDGEWIWCFSRERVFVRDPDGRVRQYIGSFLDITSRKRAEEQLERQKATFESLAENSPDVIFILDSQMRYTYINRVSEKLTGRPRDEFIGKTAMELGLPEKSRVVWEKCFNDAVSARKPCFMESDYPGRDGRRVFINANVPILSRDGELVSVLGFAHDITDLKNTQMMLERRAREASEGQRLLRALMENVPEGIIIVDADMRIRAISDYGRETAYDRAVPLAELSIEDQAPWQIFYPDGIRLPNRELPLSRAVHRGEVVINQELGMRMADGTMVPIIVNARPITDKSGNISGGIVVWRDISKLKRAEEVLRRDRETFERLVLERTKELVSAQVELEKARRLSDIGELATTVAHELRNPLGVIRTALFNVKRKCPDSGRIQSHLQNIDKKVSQSEEIINNLLFYSRLRKPAYEKLDPYHVLHEIIESLSHRFQDFTLDENLEGIKGKEMEADPTQLSELFSNILNNAHDAVKDKHGTVTVSAGLDGRDFHFEISDNGVGMDRDQLENVFEPFYTTKSKGTGLGLTVSRQIAKLHDGTIAIESEAGKGTTVRVTIPQSQGEPL